MRKLGKLGTVSLFLGLGFAFAAAGAYEGSIVIVLVGMGLLIIGFNLLFAWSEDLK